MFFKCICLCHCLCRCICICLCLRLFVGQVVCPHHPDRISQRSQVSSVALWRCSLNVFVFVIVIVFVFVFVIVFLLVRSCPLTNLIKYLNGHKARSLTVFPKCIYLCHCLCICLCHCLFWSVHVFSSLWSDVSKVTSLWGRSLKMFSKCIFLCHCLCLCLCLFFGHFMSPHHSHHMSQGSQVSQSVVW